MRGKISGKARSATRTGSNRGAFSSTRNRANRSTDPCSNADLRRIFLLCGASLLDEGRGLKMDCLSICSSDAFKLQGRL